MPFQSFDELFVQTNRRIEALVRRRISWDIEDVVERLKSYLSDFGLKIQWMSPTESKGKRPTIQTTRVMNPMTFTPDGVRTQCELHFN